MGTTILCNDGEMKVESLEYYTKGAATFKTVNLAKLSGDNYAAKENSNGKVLSVGGAHILLAVLTQNLGRTGENEESEKMIRGVMTLERLGYRPVSALIGIAKELLNGKK
jgi:hypothetical protein